MLYVLEGCDGTGKTTLAVFLSRLLNADIIHCGLDTANNAEFFKSIIHAATDRNIIADRFCYGQFVYQEEAARPLGYQGTVLTEGYSSWEGLADLEYEMLDYGVKVIYVDAPTEVIKARLKARDETLINKLSVEAIKDNYETVRKRSMLTWLDYTTGGTLNG